MQVVPRLFFVAQDLYGTCRDVEFQPADSVWGIKRIVDSQVFYAAIDIAVTSVYGLVGIHHMAVFAFGGENAIVAERLCRVEVEYEHKVAAFESQHLVVVFVP